MERFPMAIIGKENIVFTVMVQLTTSPEDQQFVVDLATEIAPLFGQQPGFISQHLHRSLDGTQVINYLQWRCKEDHEACLKNPAFMMAGMKFMGLIASGKVKMDVKTYEIVFEQEAP
jgi:heme-degrading monooxygenase HmoA